MKIEDRGFRILDICDVIPSMESDGEVLRLSVCSAGGQYCISHPLTHEDLAKVIEALSEAHRRLAPAPVAPAEARVTRLRDKHGDVWTLRQDGRWAVGSGEYGSWDRADLEDQFGPVTELADDAPTPVTPAEAPVTRLRDREGFTWTLRENDLWSIRTPGGVWTREFVEREFGPVVELADDDDDDDDDDDES